MNKIESEFEIDPTSESACENIGDHSSSMRFLTLNLPSQTSQKLSLGGFLACSEEHPASSHAIMVW